MGPISWLRGLFGGRSGRYEEQVQERCDHEWSPSVEVDHGLIYDTRIAQGHLVVQVMEEVRQYCEKCGWENLSMMRRRPGPKFATPVTLEIDRDARIEEAVAEPEDASDGGVERVVTVNRSENPPEDRSVGSSAG